MVFGIWIFMALLAAIVQPCASGQEDVAPTPAGSAPSTQSNAQGHAEGNPQGREGSGAAPVTGYPFSAVKYARRVRVLPDGRQEFLRNERYPIAMARDQDGRLMMQMLETDGLAPECDIWSGKLRLSVPPGASSSSTRSTARSRTGPQGRSVPMWRSISPSRDPAWSRPPARPPNLPLCPPTSTRGTGG